MMYRQPRKSKAYQVKKQSIKDDFVDKQVLAIHQAIVAKVIQHPELISNVLEVLQRRKNQGRMSYGAYITWLSICELVSEPETFQKAILEDSPKMRRFRRETPFVGILTEQEREQALMSNAIDKIANPEVLFS